MNPSRCYLCGLPIPEEIVSSAHPLFGTVDHIIPRSKNGPDALFNRAPAHNICNERKGQLTSINPQEFAAELRLEVVPLMKRIGRPATARVRGVANRRVLENWPSFIPTPKRERRGLALQRWEDDGGSVFRPGCASGTSGVAVSTCEAGQHEVEPSVVHVSSQLTKS
jgi:hypothetical protein